MEIYHYFYYKSYLFMKNTNAKKSKSRPKQLNPKVAKLRGVINLPPNYDYKKAIGEYLLDKYNKLKK